MTDVFASMLQKHANTANEKYKKLEGKYNDLVEVAMKKNKKAVKLQHSIKEAEVDTENDIRTADHKMKQEEKKNKRCCWCFYKS